MALQISPLVSQIAYVLFGTPKMVVVLLVSLSIHPKRGSLKKRHSFVPLTAVWRATFHVIFLDGGVDLKMKSRWKSCNLGPAQDSAAGQQCNLDRVGVSSRMWESWKTSLL